MNVLFLSYNGLLEPILTSQALPYLKGLGKEGYHFTLLTYEKHSDIKRSGKENIDMLKLELSKDGIDWVYLRYHKWPHTLSTLFDIFVGALYSLCLIIFRNIKLVHVRGVIPGTIMIMISPLVRVKVLFDMRGRLAEEMAAGGLWKKESFSYCLVKLAEKRLLETADAVTVLTHKHFEYNKGLAYLAKRNIPMDVIPCCVDLSKFYYPDKDETELKKRLGIDGAFILLYPGKLGTFYMIDEMLGFYKCLTGSKPEARFLIVTPDDPKDMIERASNSGIRADRVVYVRSVPYEEMPQYMRLADAGIFFINAYNKLGSSPIKMGEFLASGVPVVINPGVGDTEDIVRDNKIGVIVERFCEDEYFRSISELSGLMKEKSKLKERCRRTASDLLSHEEGIMRYGKIYKEMLQRAS